MRAGFPDRGANRAVRIVDRLGAQRSSRRSVWRGGIAPDLCASADRLRVLGPHRSKPSNVVGPVIIRALTRLLPACYCSTLDTHRVRHRIRRSPRRHTRAARSSIIAPAVKTAFIGQPPRCVGARFRRCDRRVIDLDLRGHARGDRRPLPPSDSGNNPASAPHSPSTEEGPRGDSGPSRPRLGVSLAARSPTATPLAMVAAQQRGGLRPAPPDRRGTSATATYRTHAPTRTAPPISSARRSGWEQREASRALFPEVARHSKDALGMAGRRARPCR